MSERVKGTLPLAVAIAVVAFVYVEVSLNFTFHWVTNGDLGNGLALPASFHFVIPAAFVSWAMFFAVGGDGAAARIVAGCSLIGVFAALVLFAVVDAVSGAAAPDFWGIALAVGLLAGLLVVGSSAGEWWHVPTIFAAFACAVFWWVATGMSGWVPGASANTVQSLADPATAGSGAFGGTISTPYGFVALNTGFTLLVGILCGVLSVRLSGLLTPKPRAQAGEVPSSKGAAAAH